jgi:acyl-ACP thioesterase
LQLLYSKTICYADIDLNNHTNNAKYVELIFDCFDQEFHREHSVKSLVVSFNAETKFGDEVNLYKGSMDSANHFIEAKNKNMGAIVFQAVVKWR